MHVSPSRGSIPEIGGKCDPFDAFAGTSAKYRGRKESKGMKKANNEQPEKDLQCQAELCGRENRRKRAWLGGNLLGRRYFFSDK